MSTYINPTREKNQNIRRLIYLLLKAKKYGKPNVGACIRAVREGKANHIEVIP